VAVAPAAPDWSEGSDCSPEVASFAVMPGAAAHAGGRRAYAWMSFAAAGSVSAATDGSGGRPSSASIPRTSPE
jgi:hypothetical protein